MTDLHRIAAFIACVGIVALAVRYTHPGHDLAGYLSNADPASLSHE